MPSQSPTLIWLPIVISTAQLAFVVTPEWSHAMNTQLPKTLDVGEEVRVVFRYDEQCFLSKPVTDVGIMDSFGRYHWAPRKDVRQAVKQFRTDFVRVGDGWQRRARPL